MPKNNPKKKNERRVETMVGGQYRKLGVKIMIIETFRGQKRFYFYNI